MQSFCRMGMCVWGAGGGGVTILPPKVPKWRTQVQDCNSDRGGGRFRTAPIITNYYVASPWRTSGGGVGYNSGPWDPGLPGVESSRLFAQRAHSARCAPMSNLAHLLCGTFARLHGLHSVRTGLGVGEQIVVKG